MKKILLFLAVLSLTSCKTKNVYLNICPVSRVIEVVDTIYVVPDNRFTREFQRADSVFSIIEDASYKAMQSAILKTKHLRP